MRFMIIVKATQDSEAGVMPSEQLLAQMAQYHEELMKSGALLDGSGLQPSPKGGALNIPETNAAWSTGLLPRLRN